MRHTPPTGSRSPRLATAVCSGLLLCLSPLVTAGAEEERPVVLQYQVSHSRNVDQISLVFRQDTVQLVVNTDSWQEETMPPRLGIFEASYNRELSRLKRELEYYRHHHTNTVPLFSLMEVPDVPGFPPMPDPHASRIFIGGEEVSSRHDHYKDLFGIIRSAWDHPWSCVDCASYRMQGDSIVRTITLSTSDRQHRFSQESEFVKSYGLQFEQLTPWSSGGDGSREIPVQRPVFMDGPLDCIPRGDSGARLECVDSRFGIFELSMPAQDTSPASRP